MAVYPPPIDHQPLADLLGADPSKLVGLLAQFAGDAKIYLDEAAEAVRKDGKKSGSGRGDFRRAVHTLKGSSGTVRAVALFGLTLVLSECAKSANVALDEVGLLLELAREEHGRIAAFANTLAEQAASGKPQLDFDAATDAARSVALRPPVSPAALASPDATLAALDDLAILVAAPASVLADPLSIATAADALGAPFIAVPARLFARISEPPRLAGGILSQAFSTLVAVARAYVVSPLPSTDPPTASPPTPPSPAPSALPPATASLVAFDDLAARFGSAEFATELLASWLAEHTDGLADLDEQLTAGDFAALSSAAVSIDGEAAMLGLTHLADTARALHAAASAPSPSRPAIDAAAASLRSAFSATVVAVQSLM